MPELTFQQDLELAKTFYMVKSLPKEQLEIYTIELMRKAMLKENYYKQMLLEGLQLSAPTLD